MKIKYAIIVAIIFILAIIPFGGKQIEPSLASSSSGRQEVTEQEQQGTEQDEEQINDQEDLTDYTDEGGEQDVESEEPEEPETSSGVGLVIIEDEPTTDIDQATENQGMVPEQTENTEFTSADTYAYIKSKLYQKLNGMGLESSKDLQNIGIAHVNSIDPTSLSFTSGLNETAEAIGGSMYSGNIQESATYTYSATTGAEDLDKAVEELASYIGEIPAGSTQVGIGLRIVVEDGYYKIIADYVFA